MKKNIISIDNNLKFKFDGDLEEYRVETIYQKEPETIAWINDFVAKSLNSDLFFFDVGANIGLFSLYASTRAKNIKVYSFEPVASNYQSLQDNIRLNDNASVNSYRCAISNRVKLTDIFLSDVRVGNSGAQIDFPINEKEENYEPVSIERVMCFSIDWLVEYMGFPCPNFIKIDVDGKESKILEGMTSTLSRPELISMLVEFNNQKECLLWTDRLREFGLVRDLSYEAIAGHSSHRRRMNGGSAVNCVFTKSKF
jgi:FkbM family methyltransferase